MEIKTKFNLGDRVWFLNDNTVCNKEITTIKIAVSTTSGSNNYTMYQGIGEFTRNEEYLFATKQELLDSL